MWAKAAKRPFEAWYEMYVKPWHPWWKCVFSLKFFLRPRLSEIGLLKGTSTRRSETGWSLQPLKVCICLPKQHNGGSDSRC